MLIKLNSKQIGYIFDESLKIKIADGVFQKSYEQTGWTIYRILSGLDTDLYTEKRQNYFTDCTIFLVKTGGLYYNL